LGYVDAYVYADGAISVSSATGYGTGIFVDAYAGNAVVNGSPAIDVTAHLDAYGVYALTYLDGYVGVSAGAIDVTSGYGAGYGVLASTSGLGGISVVTGPIDVSGYTGAHGIDANVQDPCRTGCGHQHA
jgi:hypothetical protein